MRRFEYLLTVTVTVLLTPHPADADHSDAAVREASTQFYQALNAMFTGDVAPMMEVWSHADDVCYMGPDGGFHVGWDNVLSQWQRQANLRLGGNVEPKDLRVIIGGNVAVTHQYEVGENIQHGKPEKVSIRATNVFRKENGTWKMVCHHTDLLPFLSK